MFTRQPIKSSMYILELNWILSWCAAIALGYGLLLVLQVYALHVLRYEILAIDHQSGATSIMCIPVQWSLSPPSSVSKDGFCGDLVILPVSALQHTICMCLLAYACIWPSELLANHIPKDFFFSLLACRKIFRLGIHGFTSKKKARVFMVVPAHYYKLTKYRR